MQEDILRSSDSMQTVLPVDIPCHSRREFSRRIRMAIYETVKSKPGLLETFRWIFSEAWAVPKPLPPVTCPHCGAVWDFSACSEAFCSCGEPLYVTDLLGWDSDVEGGETNVQVAARFMLVLEFLLLMTCIRQMWQEAPEQLATTLFLHDGPRSIGGRYTQMIVPLRRLFRFARQTGRPVYLCGVEKTGLHVNHLRSLTRNWNWDEPYCAVPTHAYIQQEVQGRPITAEHSYGDRHLLGDRVFVLLPEGRQYVLTIPTALEANLPDRPWESDLVGLTKILNVLPRLVTPVYDNALFPIARVNALVSMASEPGGHMLELFSDTLIRERHGGSHG